MLIGEEQDAFTLAEGPLDDGRSIGRGADNTAIAPTKGFEVGRRVHVGHRNNARLVPERFMEHLPAFFNFGYIRHVCHGATRGGIRQDDTLVRRAEDIGALGHKMYTTEDDVVGPRSSGG